MIIKKGGYKQPSEPKNSTRPSQRKHCSCTTCNISIIADKIIATLTLKEQEILLKDVGLIKDKDESQLLITLTNRIKLSQNDSSFSSREEQEF